MTHSMRVAVGATPGESDRGFCLLLEAAGFAEELNLNVWDFAVEMRSLLAAGMSPGTLRCAQCKGHVYHAVETTQPGDQCRSFASVGSLRYDEGSCFVLSPSGLQVARLVSRGAGGRLDSLNGFQTDNEVPVWDHNRQELRIGGVLVKQFKAPAPNQEAILAAFQEEAWPTRIDDPIPPHPCLDSKRRLHDTINALNRNQKSRLIRFLGDGHGLGIRWEHLAGLPS